MIQLIHKYKCDASGCEVQIEKIYSFLGFGSKVPVFREPEGWLRHSDLIYCPLHEVTIVLSGAERKITIKTREGAMNAA